MRPIRSELLSAMVMSFCPLPVILWCLFLSSAIFAADKAELQPKDVYSQNQEENSAPTVENMLKAKQAGDLEEAARIQAILNEEAKKLRQSPGGDEIVVESPYPIPPRRDNASYKSHLWDNDSWVCLGPVSGGISVDYDTGGNVYAVRCTTGGDFRIYKSTDGGKWWSDMAFVGAPLGSCYPVILTGSTGNKLYLFYLRSSQNGEIWMARLAQSGANEGSYEVKADADTITYFSACTDLGEGDYLIVVYQREEMGDNSPDLYSVVSTDQGENWSTEVQITENGSHPDIAYGNDGYVYCVHEKTGADTEIAFIRSSDYGISWELGTGEYLTSDSYDNAYPKVAALHTLPADSAYVWVAYNHENPAGTNIDLAYVWSWNGGKDWSTNLILDSSTALHEMACDLWTKRSPDYHDVHVCYFVGRYVYPFPQGHIYYGSASETNPTDWGWLFSPTNHWPTQCEDGRKICQGTFAPGNYGFMGTAIMYAGKDPDDPFGEDFRNLYFDNSAWPVDVEEEMTEEEVPAEFSLSSNYPNPFNPSTRIQYTVHSKQTPLHTTLKIYNIKGQLVRTLVDEPKQAGTYEVTWDGRDAAGDQVASGVYFCRLRAGDFSQSKKMVLMK